MSTMSNNMLEKGKTNVFEMQIDSVIQPQVNRSLTKYTKISHNNKTNYIKKNINLTKKILEKSGESSLPCQPYS